MHLASPSRHSSLHELTQEVSANGMYLRLHSPQDSMKVTCNGDHPYVVAIQPLSGNPGAHPVTLGLLGRKPHSPGVASSCSSGLRVGSNQLTALSQRVDSGTSAVWQRKPHSPRNCLCLQTISAFVQPNSDHRHRKICVPSASLLRIGRLPRRT